MKKFKKVLALGLTGASLITGGFLLSGCEFTTKNENPPVEDGAGNQNSQQKVVSSISVNADTLPNYIIKGKFARTDIKMTVTYTDNTTSVVDVTSSMFSESDNTKLNNVGQYNLTVNYEGKSATFFANVVDERYLLKEVIMANMDKDVTLTMGGQSVQIDGDSKVMANGDSYMWLKNNILYTYDSDEGLVTKGLAGAYEGQDVYFRTFGVLGILENGVDEYGYPWTIDTIEKDGESYLLTMNCGVGSMTYICTFNDDFLLSIRVVDMDDNQEIESDYVYSYNYAPITLQVPSNIKVLESSATVSVGAAVEDLVFTAAINDTKTDFEMFVDGTSYAKYDAGNKILYINNGGTERWMWLEETGEDEYTYYDVYSDGDAEKGDLYYAEEWDEIVSGWCFSIEGLRDLHMFEEEYDCTAQISEDGQYYILTYTVGDEDNTIIQYKFNYEGVDKITFNSDEGTRVGTYTHKNINLEVPDDILELGRAAK